MKAIIHFSLLALILSACSNDKITVSGKVKNYPGNAFVVEKRKGLFYQPIDTVFIKTDSTFKFNLAKNDPDIYRLNFNYRNRISILVSKADFFVEVDAGKLNGPYEVKGSPDHDLVDQVGAIYARFDSLETIVQLREQYRQAAHQKDEKVMNDLKVRFEHAQREKDNMIKDIILDGLDRGAYAGVVEMLNKSAINPVLHLEFYKKVSDRLNKEIPDATLTKNFRNSVKQMEQNINEE